MDLEKTIQEGLESVKGHMDDFKSDLENRYDKLQEEVKNEVLQTKRQKMKSKTSRN